MKSSKDVSGEPRASNVLRKLVPINEPEDVDDESRSHSSCSCDSRGASPGRRDSSPRRVRFADEEDHPLCTSMRTMPSAPVLRKSPLSAAATSSLSQCSSAYGSAARKKSTPARTVSSCSCSSAADVEYLYQPPSRSRSKSPCPAQARHACSAASQSPNDPFTFSMDGSSADARTGAKSPCSPRRRVAEELVERRQPSWWEPALSRVLSVLVSTVLLLATGGPQPSAEHLAWTKDFLRCVKDRAGNSPPNVAALLAYLEYLELPASASANTNASPRASPRASASSNASTAE